MRFNDTAGNSQPAAPDVAGGELPRAVDQTTSAVDRQVFNNKFLWLKVSRLTFHLLARVEPKLVATSSGEMMTLPMQAKVIGTKIANLRLIHEAAPDLV